MKQLMILLMFLVTSSLFAQIEVVRDENTQQAYVRTRSKVDALFARMTLDEKVAQLCGIRPHLLLGDDGKLSLEKCREIIPNGTGHLCQFAFSMKLKGIDMNAEELQAFAYGDHL